jgi:hypothetical protein
MLKMLLPNVKKTNVLSTCAVIGLRLKECLGTANFIEYGLIVKSLFRHRADLSDASFEFCYLSCKIRLLFACLSANFAQLGNCT